MGSGEEDFTENVMDKVVRAANPAKSAKKKAEQGAIEALALARKEIKRKAKMVDLRKVKSKKKTMWSFFESNREASGGQPLVLVFDWTLLEVPRAERNSAEEYPSGNSSG